jgi:disulfide bond formation protein DsbB
MTTRLGYGLGFLVCAGLIGFAYYLEYFEHQEPCPLCMMQRVAYIDMMVVFAVAAIHGPARRGAILYSGLLFVMAAMGAALAGRQVGYSTCPPTRCRHAVPVSNTCSSAFRSARPSGKYWQARVNAPKRRGASSA